jgi:hypothetical protein
VSHQCPALRKLWLSGWIISVHVLPYFKNVNILRQSMWHHGVLTQQLAPLRMLFIKRLLNQISGI